MDFELSDEQVAVRELAAQFVDREVAPHAAEWDRVEAVDLGIVPKLAKLGFLGMTVPEEHGGSGGDHLTYCLMVEELGRGDSSVRGIVSVSLGLVAKTILVDGSQEQRREWLPRLCAGEALGCFALTEPGSGSDAASLRTSAVRRGDDWVLSGSKTFITNGTWADVALVFARTGEGGPKGITAFLVPASAGGRSAASSACAARRRPSCPSTASAYRTAAGSARRAAASPSRWRRWPGAACPWPPAASASPRAACGRRCATPPSASSSAGRSRASSWCRSSSPTWRWRPTRPGCWCGGSPTSSTAAGRSPPRPPRRSCSPARPLCARPTPPCRSSAATATSTSIPSGSTCATPGSLLCTRAPARSRSSSSAAP